MVKYQVDFIKDQIQQEIRLIAASPYGAELQLFDRFPGSEILKITPIGGSLRIFLVDFRNKIIINKLDYIW